MEGGSGGFPCALLYTSALCTTHNAHVAVSVPCSQHLLIQRPCSNPHPTPHAVPGYFITIATIEKMGRKPISYMGFAMMGILLAITGAAYDQLRTHAVW